MQRAKYKPEPEVEAVKQVVADHNGRSTTTQSNNTANSFWVNTRDQLSPLHPC